MAQPGTTHPKATYRQLGRSGLRVSNPILGAMSIGDSRWAPWILDADAALPLLKAAYDRGINTWDTANVYSNGMSEDLIGRAIKTYGIPREKVVIITKCCGTVRERNDPDTLALKDVNGRAEYVNQRGLSRQGIFHAVEASLRRLGMEYMDLLQVHRFDPDTPVEETMKALHDLVLCGKVRYIGASSMSVVQFASMQRCAEKHGWTRFVSMQGHYNLLYREEEREMICFCNDTGIGLIPWGPLAQGSLARPVEQAGKTNRSEGRPPPDKIDAAIISRVQRLAERKGWPMAHVALAWVNRRISSPIIGFSSVKRIDEAIEASWRELSEDEERYLEELYRPKPVMTFDPAMEHVRPVYS